jgi:beta-glucosidase
MEPLPAPPVISHRLKRYSLKNAKPDKELSLADALQQDRLDDFIAGLSNEMLAEMLYGHPVTNIANTGGIGVTPKEKWEVEKIPNVPTADGPAGIRVINGCGMYTTYFPCATTIAQTWNLTIARQIGTAIAQEAKENNIGIWLAPGMNIHRNPLCGRNFEYYSEDPLITGLFASACVKGVQSEKIAATVKHYCANNKEINRKYVDSRVSQRALREIYLRGFEIVVKKAHPWALMTSYNPVNGVQASANWEAINGILRGEWGFDGVVMTDWWAFSHLEDELYAGSDVKMPEMITKLYPNAHKSYDLPGAIKDGTIDRGVVYASVKRILSMMDHFE